MRKLHFLNALISPKIDLTNKQSLKVYKSVCFLFHMRCLICVVLFNHTLVPNHVSEGAVIIELKEVTFTAFLFESYIMQPELEIVLTFQVANLSDYIRAALQSFRIAIGLLSFWKTFWVALLPFYQGFSTVDAALTEQIKNTYYSS